MSSPIPIEIFIKFDPHGQDAGDWVFKDGQWDYQGEYNEKTSLEVKSVAVQVDGRVTEQDLAPFNARLEDGWFKFVIPAGMDAGLDGLWFRLAAPRRRR